MATMTRGDFHPHFSGFSISARVRQECGTSELLSRDAMTKPKAWADKLGGPQNAVNKNAPGATGCCQVRACPPDPHAHQRGAGKTFDVAL
jgi:hypothetical protein